ncbi:aminotransferase class III-fold pyridoxal phosphate-dependent enzyme, partial [Aquisalimonas sp.]|uniref:aspartate aminotransferase family protein n=1 Tax=Aquisalimonas sp. TaxID=1872621 RepID=UPI0025C7377A
YKNDFGPMPGDVFRAPFPVPYHGVTEEQALDALAMLFKTDLPPHHTAAIVIEPVLGEGGFYIAPPTFLQALRELCNEHGIMLVFDEVQCGFGRTGRLFACEHSGVKPDLMTMAKSLADGMPLSAVVGRADAMDSSGPNSLGGTYSGNPLSCAAALAVLDVIEEEGILERSRALGDRLAKRFSEWEQAFDCVDNARNLGSMAAFELVPDKARHTPDAELAGAICNRAREQGLILLPCGLYGNSIRTLMPITIEDDVLEEGLTIIEAALRDLTGGSV